MPGEDAVASTTTFVIALGLFMAAFAGVLLATSEVGQDTDTPDAAADRAGAEALADILLGSAGLGWEVGPDSLQRLGLLSGNLSGLDASHLDLMRGGTFDATSNGLLDYDEATSSLGLSADEDFHLRIYPPSLDDLLQEANLTHIKAAYIGNWANLPSVTTLPLSQQWAVDDARAQIDVVQDTLSDEERRAIASLGMDYNDFVHLATDEVDAVVDLWPLPDINLIDFANNELLQGDVYPDDKQYLDDVLPGRLAQYDMLFVGSTVDHSTLTGNAVKSAIEDWVYAGGSLVVFGSDSQSFQWLQPLFHVGTASVNAGAFAPDVSHPVLLEPYELAWSDYDYHGLGWDIKSQGSGAHYDDFQHIIQDDGEDVLAISIDGSFGDGRIYLSTYRPGEIADVLGAAEATAFLTNLVLYDDRTHLYLEYGPTVPTDRAVSSAVRLSHLWDDDLGQVPVRVEVLYWR